MKYLILLFAFALCITSCGKDDDYSTPIDITMCNGEILTPANRVNETTLEVSEWAMDIRTYISSELAGYAIMNVIRYANESGNTFFLAELDNQGTLLFNETYEFICAEGDFTTMNDEEISIDDLPQKIKDYIEINYAGIGIHKAEFEDGEYEIELDNDVELCFDAQGDFIGEC